MQIFLIKYGLLAVFVAAMLEADVVPVLTGVIVHSGYIKSGSGLFVASAGALVGDCIWFWAGRYFSGTIQRSKFYRRFGPNVERLTRRWGVWQIPASHVVYGTRVATMIFWGSQGLSTPRFALIDGLGCVFFSALLFTLGFVFSESAAFVIGEVKRVELLMLVAMVLFVSSFYLVSKLLQRQFQRSRTGEPAS